MPKHWRDNPRLTNRKAYEEQRRYCERLARSGIPCAICGQPIDLDAPQWIVKDGRRVRSPWSLESDHIVPIAAGGAVVGTVGIVQPVHRACNERKGAGSSTCAARATGSSAGAAAGRW